MDKKLPTQLKLRGLPLCRTVINTWIALKRFSDGFWWATRISWEPRIEVIHWLHKIFGAVVPIVAIYISLPMKVGIMNERKFSLPILKPKRTDSKTPEMVCPWSAWRRIVISFVWVGLQINWFSTSKLIALTLFNRTHINKSYWAAWKKTALETCLSPELHSRGEFLYQRDLILDTLWWEIFVHWLFIYCSYLSKLVCFSFFNGF